MFTTDFSGENEQISLIKTDWEESSSYSRSERNVNASGQKNGSLRNYVCILATCTIVNIILFVTVVVLAILSQEETTKSKLKYTETDELCQSLNGTCREDHNKCPGSYFTGRCAGSYSRRCCTPEMSEIDAGYCPNVKIISRDSWGARRPVGTTVVDRPFQYFFIHHTAMGRCYSFQQCALEVKDIQNYHMDDPGRRYYDIAYSFLIGQDGRVYEGRGFQREGAHTKGFNRIGLAASFIGNFNDVLPNKKSQDAVKALIQCAVDRGYLLPNYRLQAHRDVGGTESPGAAFYNEIQTWPHYNGPKPSTHG